MTRVRTQTLAERKERILEKRRQRKQKLILFHCVNKVKIEEPEDQLIVTQKQARQERHITQMVKNRESARRSRQMTKQKIKFLQNQIQELTNIMSQCSAGCSLHLHNHYLKWSQFIEKFKRPFQRPLKVGRKRIRNDLDSRHLLYSNRLEQQNFDDDDQPLKIFANTGNNIQQDCPQNSPANMNGSRTDQKQNVQENLCLNPELQHNSEKDNMIVRVENIQQIKMNESVAVKLQEVEYERVKEKGKKKIITFLNIFTFLFTALLCLCPGFFIFNSTPLKNQLQTHFRDLEELERKMVNNMNVPFFKYDLMKEQRELCYRSNVKSERCNMYRSKSVLFVRDYQIVKTNPKSKFFLTEWINIILLDQDLKFINVKAKVDSIIQVTNGKPFTQKDDCPKVPFKEQ